MHDPMNVKLDDGHVPTRIHAIFRLKLTNMETAMLSVTSATEQSPSISLTEDLVLRGGRGGEGA